MRRSSILCQSIKRVRIRVPDDLLEKFRLERMNKNELLKHPENAKIDNEKLASFRVGYGNNIADSDSEIKSLIHDFCKEIVGGKGKSRIVAKSGTDATAAAKENGDAEVKSLIKLLNSSKKDGLSNADYLPTDFNFKNDETPFNLIKRSLHNDNLRLSVTLILAKSYCEFQRFFQLFLKSSKKSDAMAVGTSIHRVLEKSVHPQVTVKIDEGEERVGEKGRSKQLHPNHVVEIDRQIELFETSAKQSLADIDHHAIYDLNKEMVMDKNEVDEAVILTGDEPTLCNEVGETATSPEIPPLLDQDFGSEQAQIAEQTLHSQTTLQSDENTVKSVELDVTDLKDVSETFEFELNVPSSTFERFEFKINQSIVRLLNLFQYGECREIVVHGLYSIKDQKLLTELGEDPDMEDIVVISGIIDNLKMHEIHSKAFDEYQTELKRSISTSFDFDDLYHQICVNKSKYDQLLKVSIIDDKTRQNGRLPFRSSQLSAIEQCKIYRLLIENVSRQMDFTFKSYILNLQKRDINPDLAMTNQLVNVLLMSNSYLFNDFKKLKAGTELGIDIPGTKTPVISSASDGSFVFKNLSNNKKFDELNGEWKSAPTPKILAARYAQCLNMLRDFLDDKVFVNYIKQKNNETIEIINDDYTTEEALSLVDYGMGMWLGKRNPNPPNSKVMCNYCEFKDKCQLQLEMKGKI